MDFDFGPLAPDQGDLSSGAMNVADGVQPLAPGSGYGPYPSLVAATTATALPAAPRGLFSYQTADGTWAVVAATATDIYKMASDFTWGSSIDSGLTVTASDDVCFERFGTKLLYTDTTDGLRAYDVEAGGAASAVAAAKNPRWMFECGNILFGLDTLDNLGNRNNRLIRSTAFSDHTNWTTKGADYQPLESGGALIWGGKLSDTQALVLQQRSVKMIQVGNVGNALWGIQTISEEFGAVGSKSCVRFDGAVYWFATDGFRKFSLSGGLERIGAGFIDQYFLNLVDQSDLSLIQGSIDPFRKNVMWRWKRNGGDATVFQDIIGYNWQFKRWFTITLPTTYLGFAAQAAATWDSYAGVWDSANLPWDSRILQGGQPLFGALGPTYIFNYFGGSPLAATLETVTMPSPVNTLISWATPLDDSADGTLQIGVRLALSNSTTWKTGNAKARAGRVPVRGSGEYVAFRRNITAGSTWNSAKGIANIVSAGGGPK